MYCRHCGKTLGPEAAFCIHCGTPKGFGSSYCHDCGERVVNPAAIHCTQCGVALNKAQGHQGQWTGQQAGYGNPQTPGQGGGYQSQWNDSQYQNPGYEQQNRTFYGDDMVPPEKCRVSPGVAAFLSVMLVGLGQMINGQLVKGIFMLLGTMGLSFLLTSFIGIQLAPLFWVVSAVDAYLCARKLRAGEAIGKYSFF